MVTGEPRNPKQENHDREQIHTSLHFFYSVVLGMFSKDTCALSTEAKVGVANLFKLVGVFPLIWRVAG